MMLVGIVISQGQECACAATDGFVMVSPPVRGGSSPVIKFSFKKGGRDEFSAEIRTALARKSWQVESPVSTPLFLPVALLNLA